MCRIQLALGRDFEKLFVRFIRDGIVFAFSDTFELLRLLSVSATMEATTTEIPAMQNWKWTQSTHGLGMPTRWQRQRRLFAAYTKQHKISLTEMLRCCMMSYSRRRNGERQNTMEIFYFYITALPKTSYTWFNHLKWNSSSHCSVCNGYGNINLNQKRTLICSWGVNQHFQVVSTSHKWINFTFHSASLRLLCVSTFLMRFHWDFL